MKGVAMEKRGVMRATTVSWVAVLAVAFVLGVGVCLPYRTAPAQAYQLPDTGQTKCYDNRREIPCPKTGEPFYGQDGNYRGPQPAYRDNSDGTVTDLNTGLMWQQGDGQNDVYRNWQGAVDYCSALDLGGHTDWHLPTINELISLVDVGIAIPGPAINTTYFPECRSDWYWSGNTVVYNPDVGWGVGFDDGNVLNPVKGATLNVRCVRGEP
jgi:hypothetical protein